MSGDGPDTQMSDTTNTADYAYQATTALWRAQVLLDQAGMRRESDRVDRIRRKIRSKVAQIDRHIGFS